MCFENEPLGEFVLLIKPTIIGTEKSRVNKGHIFFAEVTFDESKECFLFHMGLWVLIV